MAAVYLLIISYAILSKPSAVCEILESIKLSAVLIFEVAVDHFDTGNRLHSHLLQPPSSQIQQIDCTKSQCFLLVVRYLYSCTQLVLLADSKCQLFKSTHKALQLCRVVTHCLQA